MLEALVVLTFVTEIAASALGPTLAPVLIHTVWPSEPVNFTPWLADNLDFLDDLGIGRLSLVQREAQLPGFDGLLVRNSEVVTPRRGHAGDERHRRVHQPAQTSRCAAPPDAGYEPVFRRRPERSRTTPTGYGAEPQVVLVQTGRTFSACGPFWPWVISNSTRWFSSSER